MSILTSKTLFRSKSGFKTVDPSTRKQPSLFRLDRRARTDDVLKLENIIILPLFSNLSAGKGVLYITRPSKMDVAPCITYDA